MQTPRFLVVSDLDGTLTTEHSVWQFVMERLGVWESHGRHHLEAFLTQAITYEEFIRLDVAAWKGVSHSRYLDIIEEVIFRPGAFELFQSLKQEGAYIVLLSSGLHDLARRAQSLFPVDRIYANIIHDGGGVLNGSYTQVVGWHGKGEIMLALREEFYPNLGNAPIIALGDTTGDLAMFDQAKLKVACFSESDELKNQADLVTSDLFSLMAQIREFLTSHHW